MISKMVLFFNCLIYLTVSIKNLIVCKNLLVNLKGKLITKFNGCKTIHYRSFKAENLKLKSRGDTLKQKIIELVINR